MATLEEKLLKKMARCHSKYEMLDSITKSASALCCYTKLHNDCASLYIPYEHNRKIADEHIPKILANLELNIQLLKLAYYPHAKECKEQLIQSTAKKYDIVDNN